MHLDLIVRCPFTLVKFDFSLSRHHIAAKYLAPGEISIRWGEPNPEIAVKNLHVTAIIRWVAIPVVSRDCIWLSHPVARGERETDT